MVESDRWRDFCKLVIAAMAGGFASCFLTESCIPKPIEELVAGVVLIAIFIGVLFIFAEYVLPKAQEILDAKWGKKK